MKLQFILLIIIFLVAATIWLLPRKYASGIMMWSTLAAYIWLAPLALALLLSTSFLQWCVWHFKRKISQRLARWLPIFIPAIPLVVCKLGFTYAHWLIPLGLSYYAFRQVHVAFECYKGAMHTPGLKEYFEYLLFLPVILIGPIHRMPEFQRSLRRHKWNPLQISEGLERILYGLVKICFLGNFVFSTALKEFAAEVPAYLPRLYLELIAFTGNAYFQFAGFSDLAIGGGLLWGVKVMENFNAPFMATNMQSFWQRWHISLSGWCRDYVFQPVAGFTRNRWMALIASMLVLALWHEISLRYVVWGIIQAVLILLTVQSRKLSPGLSAFINENKFGKWLGRLWVFHLFAFSCIFIGSESIDSLGQVFKTIF